MTKVPMLSVPATIPFAVISITADSPSEMITA